MKTLLLVLTLIQGLSVRGTVTDGEKPVADANVTLVGDKGTFQTTSDRDGAFTFAQIPIGDFQVSAKRGKLVGRQTMIQVKQDMDGIGIVLRPLVNPLVMGTIKVEGDQSLPSPRPQIVIK